ncbi:hypothetical protein FZC66_06805 [Priestia megaterium]|nr:hypothetical protein FZC66_06805 [Priestia megaterium]
MESLNDHHLLKPVNSPLTDLQSNQSEINDSGNSDVDVSVNVNVDTMPIAFVMLYSLLAANQITNEEFNKALEQLQAFQQKNKHSSYIDTMNDTSKVKIFNQYKKKR